MGIDSSNFGSEAFRAPPYVHLGSDYDPETNIGNSGKISECKPYNPPKRDSQPQKNSRKKSRYDVRTFLLIIDLS